MPCRRLRQHPAAPNRVQFRILEDAVKREFSQTEQLSLGARRKLTTRADVQAAQEAVLESSVCSRLS